MCCVQLQVAVSQVFLVARLVVGLLVAFVCCCGLVGMCWVFEGRGLGFSLEGRACDGAPCWPGFDRVLRPCTCLRVCGG